MITPDISPETILTRDEVAKWLKVNPRQVDRLGVPRIDLGHKTKRYLVRDGTLPNVGKKGAPRVRRGDLPKKPGGSGEPRGGEPDLAGRVLAASTNMS